MQIWIPHQQPRDDGDFAVRLNPGSGSDRPFAVIGLSEDSQSALVMQSVADCDRLIAAAVWARSLLLSETAEAVGLAATPKICDAVHPKRTSRCQREPGHAGGHKSHSKNEYWPRDADDEQDAGTDAS